MKISLKTISLSIASVSLFAVTSSHAQVISDWNFDNLTVGTNLTPFASSGTNKASSSAVSVGLASTAGTGAYPTAHATGPDASNVYTLPGTDADNSGASNNTWRLVGTNGWNSGAAIGTQGAQFNVSTAGFTGISFSFDISISSQGEANLQAQYSTNGGTTWFNAPLTYTGTPLAPATGAILVNSSNPNIVTGSYFHGAANSGNDVWYNGISANLAGISAANNDTNFEIRIVNASTGTSDVNEKANTAINNTSGNWRLDDVQVDGLPAAVPEPSTWALIGTGTAMLVVLLRRRVSSVL